MLKNYFKIATRNLWKNKGFSAINIIGLAVGLAICLIILMFVQDELSFDRYNKNASLIYRIDPEIQFGGSHFVGAVCPAPMGPTLIHDYPQIRNAVRFRNYGGFFIKKGNDKVEEDNVIYADSTLFEVFTLPMISGDPKTALIDPHSIVITKDIAMKYFNRTDVVGQTLVINDTMNYKVTGVIENIPEQSHFNFDFFVALSGSPESEENNWLSNNFNTYVLLKPGTDAKTLQACLNGIIEKYVFPQAQQVVHVTKADLIKQGNYVRYDVMPLTDIHLHSNKQVELGANSDIEYVYIFSLIAAFILLIACVNFMNLSTARSANRAREVGVRKVFGSLRSNLITQFLIESILISLIGLVLSYIFVALLLPYFNQLSGKNIAFDSLFNSWMLPVSFLLVLVVGLIAGSYPAFYLSRFRPIEVLKGKLSGGFKRSWLRSGLVVFQFATSIALIIGTTVIYYQLNYIRNKNLGFNRSHILVVENPYLLGDNANNFKNDALKLSGVEDATMTGYLPTGMYRNDDMFFEDASLSQDKAISMQIWTVDDHYIPTLGMTIIKGRNFSSQFLTDSNAIIINEAAEKMMNTNDPLNMTIYRLTDLQSKAIKQYHIIGVIKNFNFNSLRDVVTPMALHLNNNKGSIALRINTGNIPGLISRIHSTWNSMASGQPFSYSFMDDDFNAKYNAEQRIGKIFISFAILAIFIACLGLFGLAAYAAEQRTKEIGIRKVLGASVSNVITMMSKDFLKLVIIAAVVAFPLSWWAMTDWLNGYAYRVNVAWWIFLAAGLIAIVIALVTVSFQAIRAALANPTKSLRTE
jgi:putative ABC transport system permease protein